MNKLRRIKFNRLQIVLIVIISIFIHLSIRAQQRGRVQIENGTLVSDCGTLIRGGGHHSLDMYNEPSSQIDVFMVKHNGFNAIHVYTECYWTEYAGFNAEKMDDIVQWTRDAGLYCFMTIGGCDRNVDFDLDFVLAFWDFYAPRYADETHVIYEIQNEPGYPFTEMNAQAYELIRSHAPDTHILFASYHECRYPPSFFIDMEYLNQYADVDWSNASIAWHAYHSGYKSTDRARDLIQVLRDSGYASCCTEFETYTEDWSDRSYAIDSRLVVNLFEELNHAYLHFVPLDRHDAFRKRIIKEGYTWVPDYGTFPQEAAGPTGSVMQPPFVDAGLDTVIFLPVNSVDLSCFAYDPDGAIESHRWRNLNKTEITLSDTSAASVIISDMARGFHELTVTVTDNDQLYDIDLVKVVVAKKHSIPGLIEAEDYADMFGIVFEDTYDTGGGKNGGYFDAGDWLDYYAYAEKASDYTIMFRIASHPDWAGGIGKLFIDEETACEFDIPVTGGFQTWETIYQNAYIDTGLHVIRLEVVKGPWNLNWMAFSDQPSGVANPNAGYRYAGTTELCPVYPNPFNHTVQIPILVLKDCMIDLAVYDVLGKRIDNVFCGFKEKGEFLMQYDAKDLASGIYIIRLKSDESIQMKRIVLIR